MEDEKLYELLWNMFLACSMIFIIMMPTFCFRVSDKDYKKMKEQVRL